jgi:hypothetical protein
LVVAHDGSCCGSFEREGAPALQGVLSAGDYEMKQQLLSAVDAGLPARLALVFASVGFNAFGLRAATDAKARIIETAGTTLDRLGHAAECDVRMDTHGDNS